MMNHSTTGIIAWTGVWNMIVLGVEQRMVS